MLNPLNISKKKEPPKIIIDKQEMIEQETMIIYQWEEIK